MAFLTLLFVPLLAPWASVALRDVTLGFVHLVELGNVGLHVTEMDHHDDNKEDWSTSFVTSTMVWRSVMAIFTSVVLSSSTSLVFPFLVSTLSLVTSLSMVSSADHTHEGWLFVIRLLIILLLVRKVAALEDGSWETLGLSKGSASWLDGSADAP